MVALGNNMFPCSSGRRTPNNIITNAEALGVFGDIAFSRIVICADLSYYLIREFMKFFFFTAVFTRSSLVYHILHIIVSCSQKQMGRIYTLAIITCMANKQPWWYCAILDFVRNPRGNKPFSPSTISENFSITTSRQRTGPIPALFLSSFINMKPESIFYRKTKFCSHVSPKVKARCLMLFRFLSREQVFSTKQRAFTRKIKKTINSLDKSNCNTINTTFQYRRLL